VCVWLQAAVLIHAAMNSGQGPLTGAELAAVTEGMKVLLLLSNRTAAQGEAAQVRRAACMFRDLRTKQQIDLCS
jgi:hypothetical protein